MNNNHPSGMAGAADPCHRLSFPACGAGLVPPVPILRRMGFRTIYEIEEGRRALLALTARRNRTPVTSRRGTRRRQAKAA